MKQIEIIFPESSDPIESDDDLESTPNSVMSSAVVTATDWTTETIISQINKGNILLDPEFQRREAWDPLRKSRFIESLFLGLPIPQLVLATDKEHRGKYLVIDGKQRLLSLRQFVCKSDDSEFNQLKLKGLKISENLNNKSWEEINSDATFNEEINSFENQAIRTVVIQNWPDETFLYHVFHRLNTGSVPLSPQELRQALHPGPFLKFVNDYTIESEVTKTILRSRKPDFRMRDVELVIRFLAYRNFLAEYSGSLKPFLDLTCKRLNKKWSTSEEKIKAQITEFEDTYYFLEEVFGKRDVFRKWKGDKYESQFNRAIFDVFTYHFSNNAIREKAQNHAQTIVETFKDLCVRDEDFRSSLETTTKSLESNKRRLGIFAAEINRRCDLDLHQISLVDNRLQ